jgi:hypothetical protein
MSVTTNRLGPGGNDVGCSGRTEACVGLAVCQSRIGEGEGDGSLPARYGKHERDARGTRQDTSDAIHTSTSDEKGPAECCQRWRRFGWQGFQVPTEPLGNGAASGTLFPLTLSY